MSWETWPVRRWSVAITLCSSFQLKTCDKSMWCSCVWQGGIVEGLSYFYTQVGGAPREKRSGSPALNGC